MTFIGIRLHMQYKKYIIGLINSLPRLLASARPCGGEMENTEIAGVFYNIADLLEIKGENPFRVRSYRNAGEVLDGLPVTLKSILEGGGEKGLEEIPGVGASIREKIVEILKTGKCHFLEELLKELPPGLLDILKVSGVGPKKAAAMY